MSMIRGGSDTTLADTSTARCTSAYDMPPSIAANSSPHKYNHDAARCSRANPAGSSISPVLCASSASGERAIARPYPCDTAVSSASVRGPDCSTRGGSAPTISEVAAEAVVQMRLSLFAGLEVQQLEAE